VPKLIEAQEGASDLERVTQLGGEDACFTSSAENNDTHSKNTFPTEKL